jgi:hypothetical protein
MGFYLLIWREFSRKKMVDKQEIIKSDDIREDIQKMKTFNAEKRLTTSDYKAYNLTELFESAGLEITEKIGN